jgi:YVTN family beta-propeller protein
MLGSTCSVFNKAPSVPVISGPSAGVVGVPVTFKATATDPESDSIAFQFDWGDTTTPAWSNFIASGETLSLAHTFSDSGTFTVNAKAKDAKGKEASRSAAVACQVSSVQISWPDSLIGEIPLNYDPDRCLVTPDGQYLYVTQPHEAVVTPIRLADRAVLARVEVGAGPFCMAVTPDAQWLYITCVDDSVVAVLRTSDNTVVKHVAVGPQPKGVSVSPDGLHAYVTLPGSDMLCVIRTQDNTVEDTIPLGLAPSYVVADADGQRLYVTMTTEHLLGAVNITQRSLTDTAAVGQFPNRLNISADGSLLYVANQTDSGIAVIRTSDLSVLAHIGMAELYLGDIAVAPSGKYLLGSYWRGIECVALPAFTVVDSAPYGVRGALAFSPDGESLYVTDYKKVLVLGKRH